MLARLRSALGAMLLSGMFVPQTVVAQPATDPAASACIDAHVEAQRLRRDRRLREARVALVACSREGCPRMLIGECGPWLREVEQAIPSVVIDARAPDGREVADVRLRIDGALQADRLTGSAIEIDPGEHLLRFERAGSPAVEEKVLVSEGEHGRRVSVRFVASEPAQSGAEPPASRPIPTVVYGLSAVGLLGLGVFGTLGAVGLSKKGDLDDARCLPNCRTEDVDAARRAFLVADIGLGVGIAALASALIFYVTRPEVRRSGRVGGAH